MIVKYSAAKLHKRIEKRWSKFRSLIQDVVGYTEAQENTARQEEKEETQFIASVFQIACRVSDVYTTLGQKPTELQPADLCENLSAAWPKFKVLRAAENDVSRYIQTLSPKNAKFPLIHYFNKVLSVYAHFKTVMNWAHSLRLRKSSSMKVCVQDESPKPA